MKTMVLNIDVAIGILLLAAIGLWTVIRFIFRESARLWYDLLGGPKRRG